MQRKITTKRRGLRAEGWPHTLLHAPERNLMLAALCEHRGWLGRDMEVVGPFLTASMGPTQALAIAGSRERTQMQAVEAALDHTAQQGPHTPLSPTVVAQQVHCPDLSSSLSS